jgi:hypothetical protein
MISGRYPPPSRWVMMPQQVVAAAWPTDAMGYLGLFIVLAFLGREKIGSASALSGFPLNFFGCGQ